MMCKPDETPCDKPEQGSARTGRRLSRLLASVAGCGALASCSLPTMGFLAPRGPAASDTRELFIRVTLWMLIVVVPAMVLAPFFAWRYRLGKKGVSYKPNWAFSWPLEIIIWGVPMVIVGFLGVTLWQRTHELDPYRPINSPIPALEVQVVGLDWNWLFIYPQQRIASLNELVVPAGRPFHLTLTSATVMQSFMIPQLGGQIYLMAGMTTQLNLRADAPGTFVGQNMQFNGRGFQSQKFTTLALPPQDFERWVTHTSGAHETLDAARYGSLSARRDTQRKQVFSAVEPALFEHVVRRYHVEMPAGPAPVIGTGHE